jgi:hypothetical protein
MSSSTSWSWDIARRELWFAVARVLVRTASAYNIVLSGQTWAITNNGYLWHLSDVPFGEHSKTSGTGLDFTFCFVDADVDLDKLRKILLDDLLSVFLDETVVPSLFSHAYLHNLVNHIPPYE